MLLLILLISTVVLIITACVWWLLHQRRGRGRILSAFQQLAATLPLAEAKIERYPILTLMGLYRTYPITVECSFGRWARLNWRVAISLKKEIVWRLYVEGEGRSAKLRRVADLKPIVTGDDLFDGRMLLTSSELERTKSIFGDYLRSRLVETGLRDFSINIEGKEAVLDLADTPNIVATREMLSVFVELINIIEVVS